MNTNEYLKIKHLRDQFDEALNSEADVLAIEKADLLTLFNASLGRTYGEVEFNAKLIKITPKERRDDDILEVTLSATFDNDLLGGVGKFFGRQLTVYLEPAPAQESYDDDDDEYGPGVPVTEEDPSQLALPLDADEDGAQIVEQANADPLTSYTGDDPEIF
jgi:hypothetical protein